MNYFWIKKESSVSKWFCFKMG